MSRFRSRKLFEIVLIFSISLASCQSKKNIEQRAIVIEILESHGNMWQRMSYNNSTNKKSDLFCIIDENQIIKIGEIKKGKKLQVIGNLWIDQEKRIGEKLFLVSYQKSVNLWEGWIKQDDLKYSIPEKANDYLGAFAYPIISPNNNYLTDYAGPNGYVVINRKGDLVFKFNDEMIQEKLGVEVERINAIGWSDDSVLLWYAINNEQDTVGFMKLDVESLEIEVYPRPKSYEGYQIEINYNNGDTVYTDYRYQFDVESAEEIKRSGQVFYLYKNNLINQSEQVIDHNEGVGFFLTKTDSNKLGYKKDEGSDYKFIN